MALAPDRWEVVERPYHDALARPLEARAAFLAEACTGDDVLRREVESLLAQSAGSGDFLADPAIVLVAQMASTPAASVLTGRRIGIYELHGLLGAGGMGEVYRARDTKLGRDVAIKILPSEFTSHPDRLARFQREARVLASLNHRHIGAIYGIEDGPCEAGPHVHALVLELVEGQTLAERIARGPVPIAEALTIARQIADALDAAHEKGIVHRDLKPANIKITPDGVVKVLDFGLAKAGGEGVAADLTHSPTMTVGGTREGMILGTAAYMSPEQARGQAVDKRTDVWAFACVLHEMLTGRVAFAGATISDTIVKILERDPDWKALPATTPAGVVRLLCRSLDKDLKHRLRDIGDARLELEDALAGSTEPWQMTAPHSPRVFQWMLASFGAVVLVAVAGWLWFQQQQVSSAEQAPNDARLERLTYDSGTTTMPALSPDGRLLAYASDRASHGDLDIWVQQTAAGAPLQLTSDPADDDSPDFSPDGSQIVFRSDRNGGGIYVMPALGGPARLIASNARTPRFSPDGTQVAYWTGLFRGDPTGQPTATFVLPLTGGAPRRLLPDFNVASHPLWSPDGRSLLVLGRRDLTSPVSEVLDWWWVPLDGRPPSKSGAMDFLELRKATAANQVTRGSWASAGVMFSVNGSLWSLPISAESGRVAGSPRRLTFGTGQALGAASSRDGQVVFAIADSERVIERVSLDDPAVAPAPSLLYADNRPIAERASETSDGSLIVFERGFPGYREIWQRNIRSEQQEMILRVDNPNALNTTVSPDGTRIAYTVPTGSIADVGNGFVLERAGGVPRSLCQNCEVHGFLSDNKRLLVVLDSDHVIAVVDATTGRREDVVRSTETLLSRPHASPDDRWLAFRNVNGTVGKSFLTALVPGRPAESEQWQQVQEPTMTGRPTGWSLDSRVLYLFLDSDGSRCLWGQRVDGSGRLSGLPFVVRHLHRPGGASTSFGNSITREGLLYERSDTTANLWRIVNPRVEERR